ncbi:pilus assembly protein [Escherichia coli]|nr:pilus assembly protein [Escherichia coli]
MAAHIAKLNFRPTVSIKKPITGNDSNLLIVFYVQIMPDDFVMQLHRF